MVKIQSNKYCDFLVDDYGLFYTLCFEGFDDCYSDDESDISDDDTGSLDKFILNDADDGIDDDGIDDGIDDGVDGGDSINSDDSCTTESTPYSDDELDEDINNY